MRGIIDFLYEKSEDERLLERVTNAVSDEEDYGKENRKMIDQFLSVMESNESHRRTLELVLYALNEHGIDEWGVPPQFIKLYEKGFFDKFNKLLNEFGLSSDD